MNWVAGSRWDERSAGTNAPAAAMRLDTPCRSSLASTTPAMSRPGRAPRRPSTTRSSGGLLGALDITGRDDVAAPAVLGLVRAAVAAADESELRIGALGAGRPAAHRDIRSKIAAG